jgi:hypothetical protein
LASETRIKPWEHMGDMLHVVDPEELPGELAVAFYDGAFRLYVSADALRWRPVRALAHDAVHMLRNTRSCDLTCDDNTRRIEDSLLAVLALADLA